MNTAQSTRLLRGLLSLLLPLIGCSCVLVTIPWPPLPKTTYQGVVVDPEGRPVRNAAVELWRTGKYLAKSPFDFLEETEAQDLGRTRTGRDGTFRLTTTRGYATEVRAEKGDHLSVQLGTLDTAPAPRLPEYLRLELRRY